MGNRVECNSHGKAPMAFVCVHLLSGERVGWNEPEEYTDDPDDEFSGCLNAWCDACEEVAESTGGWNEESEKFADIHVVCEPCALSYRELNN